MGNIIKSFDAAFKRMRAHNSENIRVLVKVQDIVFSTGFYSTETYEWFPYAEECLEMISKIPSISLVLWTSNYDCIVDDFIKNLDKTRIRATIPIINDGKPNTKDSDISIEGKFGFVAPIHWKELYKYLENKK